MRELDETSLELDRVKAFLKELSARGSDINVIHMGNSPLENAIYSGVPGAIVQYAKDMLSAKLPEASMMLSYTAGYREQA